MITDPHDLDNGGHEPVDVDPYIPTGICVICAPVPEPEPEPDIVDEHEGDEHEDDEPDVDQDDTTGET